MDAERMQTVHIYIDTDIKGRHRKRGTYMYIIAAQTARGTADAGSSKTLEETTENQATLIALQEALQRLRKPCYLVIHLECQYVADALENRWYEKWREHDWQNAKNRTVKYVEEWRATRNLFVNHDFKISLREPHEYREWMQRELRQEGGQKC